MSWKMILRTMVTITAVGHPLLYQDYLNVKLQMSILEGCIVLKTQEQDV